MLAAIGELAPRTFYCSKCKGVVILPCMSLKMICIRRITFQNTFQSNFFMYFLFWKKMPWPGRENKPKPWQPRNLQKYNKKKQEYNNKTRYLPSHTTVIILLMEGKSIAMWTDDSKQTNIVRSRNFVSNWSPGNIVC